MGPTHSETAAVRTTAIAKATGITWEQWLDRLHAADAASLPHGRIAELAVRSMPAELENPEWWAQGVAVAFEQHIGRRVPGQASDGSFQGSVSKTVGGDPDEALERFRSVVGDLPDFNGHALSGEPSISSSQRWRYWKASFDDGTKTQVDIGLKGEKSVIAINVTKASSPESVSEWKGFWRQILTRITV